MAALTKDYQSPQSGTPSVVWPQLNNFGVEANTTIYGGALVAIDSSGYAVPASAVPGLRCVGRCQRQVVNTTAAGFGSAGALTVEIQNGAFDFGCPDSSITTANFGQYCYAVDDNNVSMSDGGGQRPIAGFVVNIISNSASGAYNGRIIVQVGAASPYGTVLTSPSTANTARVVATSIHAYTGSTTGVLTSTANGAFGTVDGLATAVGDTILLPAGTTNITAASDAGPYVITTLGTSGTPWVLTRPDWWATGSTMPFGDTIKVGGGGTLFGGTSWKSYAVKGSTVVDTNDPLLYPDHVTQSVSLTAGAATITNVPIYSATRSNVICTLSALGGTNTNTCGYGTIVAATPGAINTASVVVNALAVGMTKYTADTSTILVTIINS